MKILVTGGAEECVWYVKKAMVFTNIGYIVHVRFDTRIIKSF